MLLDKFAQVRLMRDRGLIALVAGLVGLTLVGSVQAQDSYPQKVIRIIVPFSAGGQTDIVARTVAGEMSRTLGQPMVVENRLGAAGAIAADFVASSPPDGYTVCLCGSGPMILLPLIDPGAKNYPRDLPPVSLIYLSEYVLIGRNTLAANTARELFADIQANPGKYTFGSSGTGGIQQLGMELLATSLNSKMVHVPYKGEQPAAIDVGSGQVDLMMSTIATAMPLIKGGKVKTFAMTGAERNPEMPQLPTIASLGFPSLTVYTHGGFNVPRGTPQQAVEKLNGALAAAMKSPAMLTRMKEAGLITPQLGASAYADYVRSETEKWAKVIRSIEFKRE